MSPELEIRRLVERLRSIAAKNDFAELEWAFIDAEVMADHNEWGIALENLCSNLHEFEFPLTSELYGEIEALAHRWGIDQSWVDPLKELLPDST